MVEIDISSTEKEEDAFWTMLAGLGIDVSEIAIEDDNDRDEFHEVETDLESFIPSSNNAPQPTSQDIYVLNMILRSSCVAHLLQIAIKTGLSALQVFVLHIWYQEF